tara:strand:- start:767 stop:916 length:150 start_codon:yes stop_codon:yes gene_type:complete
MENYVGIALTFFALIIDKWGMSAQAVSLGVIGSISFCGGMDGTRIHSLN